MNGDDSHRYLSLYSEECLMLLQKSLEYAETTTDSHRTARVSKSRYADDDDDWSSKEGSNEEDSQLSSSSSSDETEGSNENSDSTEKEAVAKNEQMSEIPPRKPPKKKAPPKMDERQRLVTIRKHFSSLSCVHIPYNIQEADESIPNKQRLLQIPTFLIKTSRHDDTANHPTKLLHRLSASLQTNPVVILSLSSGRFAAGVFAQGTCIEHTTSVRYTVRKGQGKAQSTQDGNRRPKSVGSQLRRAGEQQLQEDVKRTLLSWETKYIAKASVILLSVPKTMLKLLWEVVLRKDDDRLRRVPLDVGKPTFEQICMIHHVSMTVLDDDFHVVESPLVNEEELPPRAHEITVSQRVDESNDRPMTVMREPTYSKLTELHLAARDGNVESLEYLLRNVTEEIVNAQAGPDSLTPLHFAAQSTEESAVEPNVAAECVLLLLEKGRANPCQVDVRNRPPYFLASHERVREAFRKARANLGEAYCAWDDGAKVGPPLSQADLQAKKEKDAEKRKKKKARQKERKQKERSQKEEAERLRQEEEERKQKEAEAKRVRDGLDPKARVASGAVCDYCQTVCKGRKRAQMFKRLEYSYCSSECVQKHKRELMAAAAQRRLG